MAELKCGARARLNASSGVSGLKAQVNALKSFRDDPVVESFRGGDRHVHEEREQRG